MVEVSDKKCFRSLRDVKVDYEINNEKCKHCMDKPCIPSCPVSAVYIDSDENYTKINERCIGCVICREACPYDAISMDTVLAKPILENVPNINVKLCRSCGACVQACKSGAVHLASSGHEEVHSEIDEDKCVRCGYCARFCPTDAIKYGEILPRTVSGGKAIVVNQKKCIGCMTCTRICPSKGAINVGNVSKLPYINPSYCARCEECMNACPTTAIKYSSRKKAYSQFSQIKSLEIVREILNTDTINIARNVAKIDSLLNKISRSLSTDHNEDEFEVEITDLIMNKINYSFHNDLTKELEISIVEFKDIIEYFPPIRKINLSTDKCIGCGECMNVCPTKCIHIEVPAPAIIGEDCVYCGKCIPICPVDAIDLKEEFFTTKENSIYFKRRTIKGLRNGTFLISNDACQSCGICINKCSVDALSMEKDVVSCDEDKCIYCRECESLCPVNAIKICIK
ncbi:4Fe-4S binding protein [Methanobrevibacter filiformis]|nr:4Fe-4S binding protein [Methanobrevibacter filiformis]